MKPNGNSPVSDGSSSTRWAPILGHWSVGEDQIAYKGGDERFVAHGQEFPIGILVNNRELISGACRVDVEFEDISSGHFAGGIILRYRSQERYYLQVQLGAGLAAYCVSEFVSGFGWRPLKLAGPRDVLEARRKYALDVSLRGQELRVSVDGVKVLEILISRPLEGKQTGLTAAGAIQSDSRISPRPLTAPGPSLRWSTGSRSTRFIAKSLSHRRRSSTKS